jgi:hypothetical protein
MNQSFNLKINDYCILFPICKIKELKEQEQSKWDKEK